MNLTDLAVSGPLLLAALLAITAGAVSFASPCCLPLVPGYLAYLAGVVGAPPPSVTPAERTTPLASGRWRVAGAALLFVLGFTVVFATATLAVLGLSDALLSNEALLQRIGGVVTIAMGLVFLGVVPVLQGGMRVRHTPRDGLWGAPLLGGTQVGPTTGRGLLLIAAYCLGLGLPFVLLALGARWAIRTASWLRRHIRAVQQAGGMFLIAIGVALVTGLWGEVIVWLRGPIAGFTIPI